MPKPKRSLVADALAQAEERSVVTPSRDVIVDVGTSAVVEPTRPPTLHPRRRSPNDVTRHTYHASLYLPEEAQFALREIALTMRRAKPHDVMLEAMAELFDKYNKAELAEECRQRILSRDRARR